MPDNTIQPITDDAELAKVLDGMKNDQNGGLTFEETANGDQDQPAPAQDQPEPPQEPAPQTDDSVPMPPTMPEPSIEQPQPEQPGLHDTQAVSPELDSIKKSALEELRPLVDKLELPADEKFDTLLLIIRSTDDQSLVSHAYEVAKTIENDSKRAEALLDIIKEIDYFANPQQNQQP